MKRLRQLTKAFAVHAIIFSLLQTALIFYPQNAFAEQQKASNASAMVNIGAQVLNTFGQALNQKQALMMQQVQAQKNAQLMQTLSPACRKADGTSCYTNPGKFFPECPLPATIAAMPRNVCSETIPDPAQSAMQISSMHGYENLAQAWVDYYTQMQNEATNLAVPFGLKCLEDKKKALDSQLLEMVNNLTRLQETLNRDKETFRAANKKMLDELATTNDELLGAGGTNKNNLKLKTQNFSKLFSPSCQSVIGEQGMAEGPAAGLVGVMQSLVPVNKRASDFNNNRAAIINEVDSDIAKMQLAIKNGGLQDFFDGKVAEGSKFKSLNVAAQKQALEFKLEYDRTAKELAKLSYTIPTMDANFSADFGEFLNTSQEFFQKEYVNNCVTGADMSGVAISTGQILAALQQKSTNNGGNAREKYRAALQAILNKNISFEDKILQIKDLENTFKDISITYQDNKAQTVTESPYDLYMRTLKTCKERLSIKENKGLTVSQEKRIERGQTLLRSLKRKHDMYASELQNAVLSQVLSCNGESKKEGATCGDKESFDHTAASFCINHASQCANEVNGCFAEATKNVETRKTKMENIAKTYNANVDMMVKRSNQLYDAQKLAVTNMVKLVQARIPGTNFIIPENMFISMPEMKKDAFGVDLANDGNLAFMDELPKKLDLLKKMFTDQKAAADSEIDDYINKQAEAMSVQKERWTELGEQCKNMSNSIAKDLARYNAEGAKAQAQQDQLTGNFCRKYSALRQNPSPACDDAQQLAEDMDQVAARLSNQALHYTGTYRNICNQYNNEGNEETLMDDRGCGTKKEEESSSTRKVCDSLRKKEAKRIEASLNSGDGKKSKRISLESLCKNNDEQTNDDEAFIKAVSKKLPESEQQILRGAENFADINKKAEKLDDATVDFFRDIKRIANNAVPGNKQSICEKLLEANKHDSGDYSIKSSDKIAAQETEKKAALEASKKTLQDEAKALNDTMKTLVEDRAKAVAAKNADEQAAIDKKIEKQNSKIKVSNESAAKINKEIEKGAAISESANFKLALNEALASLTPVYTKDDLKELAINNLGQQTEEACEAQASNINGPKGMGSMLQMVNEALATKNR